MVCFDSKPAVFIAVFFCIPVACLAVLGGQLEGQAQGLAWVSNQPRIGTPSWVQETRLPLPSLPSLQQSAYERSLTACARALLLPPMHPVPEKI